MSIGRAAVIMQKRSPFALDGRLNHLYREAKAQKKRAQGPVKHFVRGGFRCTTRGVVILTLGSWKQPLQNGGGKKVEKMSAVARLIRCECKHGIPLMRTLIKINGKKQPPPSNAAPADAACFMLHVWKSCVFTVKMMEIPFLRFVPHLFPSRIIAAVFCCCLSVSLLLRFLLNRFSSVPPPALACACPLNEDSTVYSTPTRLLSDGRENRNKVPINMNSRELYIQLAAFLFTCGAFIMSLGLALQ